MADFLLPRIPASTYRVQFNNNFRFEDAKRIIPYLHDLGITDLYASPYFKSREGSLHGYDIVDHNALNPEIGSEKECEELTVELRRFGMGQILDIVPNHMCITSDQNSWWMDVLENGQSSRYALFFDIDWNPIKRELKNKVLLPFLADQYGKVLENGELELFFEKGAFFVRYFELRFPVRPRTYTSILRHRIGELEVKFSADDPQLLELLSIITALRHLPPHTERDLENILERTREKEIIKKRLHRLSEESPEIQGFILENVRIFNGIKGSPKSFDLLDRLLSDQVYRLSHWRVAGEEINYRRFFDINDFATIRMEMPEVYSEAHRLVMRLIRQGKVTGLRVDHPDGLYNPSEYFRRLQKDCFIQMRLGHIESLKRDIPSEFYPEQGEGSALTAEPEDLEAEIARQYEDILSGDPQYKPFYIVGEKILTKGERMPEDWPIFSTTGYVFLNTLNGLFVEAGKAKRFDAVYDRFVGSKPNYQEIAREAKKLVTQVAMAAEINTLAHHLGRIAGKDRNTRDFTLNSLAAAIREVIAAFPVYRTYASPDGVTDRDRRYIEIAIAKAKHRNPAVSESIFDFVRDILLLRHPERSGEDEKRRLLDFVMRFQQTTGPVMAKGVEDTAFYIYNRLVSLNEVGGNPDRFGMSLETFHGQNIERSKFWPQALITTSTHDTKRSEDVRARINALSEVPEEWRACLTRWNRMNRKRKAVVDGRAAPDRNEEYLLYQTLIGVWPPMTEMTDAEYGELIGRIKQYMVKATREAKINTSWIRPNVRYEDALAAFIEGITRNSQEHPFPGDFLAFQRRISHCGMFNSLSQAFLKITSPGVADFYQGTEIWNFSLVDPDNRRPVDYERRASMLRELKQRESELPAAELSRDLLVHKEDGMVKLYLIYRALNYRKERKELFERGEYLPLEVTGKRANNVCAFARRAGGREVVIAAPRLFSELAPDSGDLPLGEKVWEGSFVAIPSSPAGAEYLNVFTGETVAAEEREGAVMLALSGVFANFPAALLERVS